MSSEPMETTTMSKKRISIQQVENGYTIQRTREVQKEGDHGPYTDYQEVTMIAKDIDDLQTILNEWLG